MNMSIAALIQELEAVKSSIPQHVFERLMSKVIEAGREDRYLTVSEVMQRMGITSRNTLTKWIDEYGLRTTRLPGGHIRIRESELERFLAEQQPKSFNQLMAQYKELEARQATQL